MGDNIRRLVESSGGEVRVGSHHVIDLRCSCPAHRLAELRAAIEADGFAIEAVYPIQGGWVRLTAGGTATDPIYFEV